MVIGGGRVPSLFFMHVHRACPITPSSLSICYSLHSVVYLHIVPFIEYLGSE